MRATWKVVKRKIYRFTIDKIDYADYVDYAAAAISAPAGA
jgi:hypothetical protein